MHKKNNQLSQNHKIKIIHYHKSSINLNQKLKRNLSKKIKLPFKDNNILIIIKKQKTISFQR